MGVWGTKPFEGDMALDLVGDVTDKRSATAGIKVVDRALYNDRELYGSPSINIELAVAASEIINAMRGNVADDGKNAPDELLDWVDKYTPKVPAALVEKAKRNLQALIADPSLLRLWATPAKGRSWKKNVEDVLRRLKMRARP